MVVVHGKFVCDQRTDEEVKILIWSFSFLTRQLLGECTRPQLLGEFGFCVLATLKVLAQEICLATKRIRQLLSCVKSLFTCVPR